MPKFTFVLIASYQVIYVAGPKLNFFMCGFKEDLETRDLNGMSSHINILIFSWHIFNVILDLVLRNL